MSRFKELRHELAQTRLELSVIECVKTLKQYIALQEELDRLLDRDSLAERRSIEDSKAFARGNEKTQVVMPQNGLDEVVKNRATHSYEVTTSSMVMASFLADSHNVTVNEIDYMRSIYNASLLHDLGHPPFGHFGAEYISDYFKKLGLKEGFDDNNNNLVVVEKNKILVRDYTLASIIKYPARLYPSQQEKYGELLRIAIEQDKEHFSQFDINLKGQKKTIACQIMDEADRNSYTCSDLSDFLCMGSQLEAKNILQFAERFNVTHMVDDLIEVANCGSKNEIKKFFSDLKESFNFNHRLDDNGLSFINNDRLRLRELLSKLSFEFYIKPLRSMDFHTENKEKLKLFIDEVVNNNFHPSSFYREKLKSASTKEDRLIALRDMIGEVSDWYVINTCKKLGLEPQKKIERASDFSM